MRQFRAGIVTFLVVTAVGCAKEEPPPPDEEGLPADPRLGVVEPDRPGAIGEEDPPSPIGPVVDEVPVDEVPADCAQVRVEGTGGIVLNVRPDPSTSGEPVGALSPGAIVDVLAIVDGQVVNDIAAWYEIEDGAVTGFISGAFASCFDPSAPVDDGFYLPLACGTSTTITQGNNSSFSHNGNSAFAFDFSLPRGTPLVAINDGIVIFADGSTRPGDPCWSGGGQSCINEANYIVVEHEDGTASMYAHLDEPSLNVGDVVLRGEQVGLSGGTGWSTGPHAHVARMNACGSPWCQSIAVEFVDVDGGVPQTGDVVTSANCP